MMKISILRCLKVNKSFFDYLFIPLLQYLECKLIMQEYQLLLIL